VAGPELLEWIDAGGTIGLLVAIVAGAVRGWWIPGRLYERTVTERDRLLELAIRSTSAASSATDVMRGQRQTVEEVAARAAAEAVVRAQGDEGWSR
jgi:hypothetical protein